jgi:hypothetical protein
MTHAPRRTVPALVIAVAVVVTAAFMVKVSMAAYTSSTGTSASLGSASCYHRASTQSGTATSSANGTTAVTITAVDPAKAFLLFSTRHSLDRPVAAQLRGRIASSTGLEFVRVTDEGSPVTVTIEWSVVEYVCGVTVQRGAVAPSGTSFDVAITPVPSLAQAFVTWSKTPAAADTTYSDNDPVVVQLTAVDNIQFRMNSFSGSHLIWWQVVSFTDPNAVNVQHGTASLLGAATSTTASITAVALSKSFVLASVRIVGGGVDIGSAMVRARLTDSSTVTFDRSAANYDVTEIGWQVVQLLDGSSVQSGTATLGVGTSSTTAALTTISLSRTSAFASTQTGGGQTGGRTSYTADDNVGVATAGLRLTSTTQLTLTRNSTVAAADIAWFVVAWGTP